MSKQIEKIKELIAKREQARLGGGEKAIEKQHARGKYTARERIEMLVDAAASRSTTCSSCIVAPTSAWRRNNTSAMAS